MNNAFAIKYSIGKKEKDEIRKCKNSKMYENDIYHDGSILIKIGDYDFGFLPSDDFFSGTELLDEWFKSFKEVYNKLKKERKLVFDYWEEPHLFFVFELNEEIVNIKYFERLFPVIDGRWCQTNVFGINLIAETNINEKKFFTILKDAVNNYWEEIIILNPVLKDFAEKNKIS